MLELIIIIAICLIYRRNRRVESLKEKYAVQILIALNKDHWDSSRRLTSLEKRKILRMNVKELEKWRLLSLQAMDIARRYPNAFVEQVLDVIKSIKDRPYYEYNSKKRRSSDIANVIAESLTIEELQLVLSESEINWKSLEVERKEAQKIRAFYPRGFEQFIKHESAKINSHVICHNKNTIKQYQQMYDTAQSYNVWEQAQIEFCSKIWQVYKDCRPDDGRYCYEVPYYKPNEEGKKYQSTFKIWQGFLFGYTPFCRDSLTEFYLQQLAKVDEFRICQRYFYLFVYRSLVKMVETCAEQVGEKPLVVIVSKNEFNWEQTTYDYHLKYFFDTLRNNNYELVDREELNSLSRDTHYKMVIIFDLITTNEQLFYNASLVVEHFSYAIPNLAYYSIIKQFDEDETKIILKQEMDKIKKTEEDKLSREQELEENNGKAFVKDLFLKMDKHPFFSYIAITNTLIGGAVKSEQIGKVWLSTPEQFYIKSIEKNNGSISCEYSDDFQKTFHKFETEGQDDLEGIVNFTYRLFVKMGVWQQFVDKGADAIDAMNRLHCLKYH